MKCEGEDLRWRGGGLTSVMESVIRGGERFLRGGESFLRDKLSLTRRRGSVTRDRSRLRTGEGNERKDEVTRITTRRWNHGKISEKRT